MRKLNIFTVLFVTVITAVVLVLPSASAFTDPDMTGDAALLVEAKSGTILYEKNKDTRVASGSITGVMTLLLAVEAIEDGKAGIKDDVTASETFLNGLSHENLMQKIQPGETMSFLDLMHCAYLTSASDACNILAEELSGSIWGFVNKMNKKAEELGCRDTYFANAGGMIAQGQYTSAWDQYLIFKEAIGHPLFLDIAGTRTYKTEATAVSPSRSLMNENEMLLSNSESFYQYCIAGKTGSPSENSPSFISLAVKNELALISVNFGSKSAGGESASAISQSFSESEHLFEWGFNGFSWQDIISRYDIVAIEKIAFAQEVDVVELNPYETMTLLIRNDLKAEDIKRDIVIYGKSDGKILTAPVKKGDILGEMTVYVDGVNRGKLRLAAAHTVELDKSGYIKSQISHTLSRFWVQLIIFVFLILMSGYVWLVIRDRKIRREKRRVIEEARQKIIEERQRPKINR